MASGALIGTPFSTVLPAVNRFPRPRRDDLVVWGCVAT